MDNRKGEMWKINNLADKGRENSHQPAINKLSEQLATIENIKDAIQDLRDDGCFPDLLEEMFVIISRIEFRIDGQLEQLATEDTNG